MSIERLRALEKKWRKKAENASREAGWSRESASFFDERDMLSRAETYTANADELATLIAELGQEVGAVPNGKLVGWWNGITPGFDGMGVPSIRWGADAENRGHDIPLYDGYNPIHYVTPPSSPAHTSEARDAAMRLLYSQDLYGMLMDVQNGIDSPASASIANSLIRRIDASRDAAMRQEAGDGND